MTHPKDHKNLFLSPSRAIISRSDIERKSVDWTSIEKAVDEINNL